MDQLFSTFGIDGKLLLTQVINFAVLLTALSYFLYTPLMNLIDERRKKIAEGVAAAEAASQRLAAAQAESQELVGAGAREAEGLVAAARVRAEEKGTEIVEGARSKADALLKEAQAGAEESKRRAMAESEKEIAKAALLAAEKILQFSSCLP
jgi:F-type H+-transporting ATPase subunit b